eukprot:s968_g32.t1
MSKQVEFAGSVLDFWCGKTHALHVPRGSQIQDLMPQRRFHFFWCIPKMCHRVFQPLAQGEGRRVDRQLDGQTRCSGIERDYEKRERERERERGERCRPVSSSSYFCNVGGELYGWSGHGDASEKTSLCVPSR